MADVVVERLITQLLAEDVNHRKVLREAVKELDDMERATDDLNKKQKDYDEQAKRSAKSTVTLKEAAANAKLQLIGLGAAAAGFTAIAVKMAADAEEIKSKFEVTFQGITREADMMANKLAEDFDLSSSRTRQLLGNTGDLLTGFGFTREAALKMSADVTRLAGDLTSFANVQGGVESASQRLTAALLGETESAKMLGIVIRQDDPAFKAMMKRMMEAEGLSIQQAKAQAVLQTAMEQSKNAIGDYARTQDSFTNQSRALGEMTRELTETFGKLLLPVATELLKPIKSLLEFLQSLNPQIQKAIAFTAAFAGASFILLTTYRKLVKPLADVVIGLIAERKAVLGNLKAMVAWIAKRIVQLSLMGPKGWFILAGAVAAATAATVAMAKAMGKSNQAAKDAKLLTESLANANTLATESARAYEQANRDLGRELGELSVKLKNLRDDFNEAREEAEKTTKMLGFARLVPGVGSVAQRGIDKANLKATIAEAELTEANRKAEAAIARANRELERQTEGVITNQEELAKYEKEAAKLKESLKTPFQKGTEAIERYDAMLKVNLITQEEHTKAVKKAQADMDKNNPLKKRNEELKREGEKLRDAMRTPFEKAQDAIRKYDELLMLGMITEETYRRAVEKTNEQLEKRNKPDDRRLLLDSAALGSQEDIRIRTEHMMRGRAGAESKEKMMLDAARDHLRVARDSRDSLETIKTHIIRGESSSMRDL